jgi:hypothetical protein
LFFDNIYDEDKITQLMRGAFNVWPSAIN